MSTPPQVALALTSFDASPVTGFAFSLEVGQTNQNLIQVILFTPWNVTVWRSLKVSLLASSRSDAEVGLTSFKNLPHGQDQVTVPFKRRLPTTSGYISRPFLCGVTLSKTSNSVAVSLVGRELSRSSINVGINSACGLTAVTVSYIVFSPSTAGFASYGGIIDQPAVPEATYLSIHKSLCSLENYIYGLNGFTFGAAPSVSLSSSIDRSFVLTVNPGQITTKLTFSYIVYGPSPKFVCSNCADKISGFGGNCLSQCDEGEALYTYPDGSQGCIICSDLANLVVSADGSSCVCKPGTTNVRGVCTLVEPYKTDIVYGFGGSQTTTKTKKSHRSESSSQSYADYLAGLAISGSSATNSNSNNAGSTTSSSNSASAPLKPIFGDGKINNNNGGSFIVNKPATVAPITGGGLPVVNNSKVQTITVTTTGGAPPNCTIPNTYWNGASCACLPTYTNNSGNCVPNSQGWVKVTTTTTGGSQNGLPPTVSPINPTNSPAPAGPTSCTSIPNSYWNGASCTCYPGYTNSSGQCINQATGPVQLQPQPQPQPQPPTTQPINGAPASAPSPQGNCNGVPNSYWNGAGCACLPGFTIVNNQCQPSAPAGPQPATVPPTNGVPGAVGLPPTTSPIGSPYPGGAAVAGTPTPGWNTIAGPTYPTVPGFNAAGGVGPVVINPISPAAPVPAVPIDPSQVIVLPPGYPNGQYPNYPINPNNPGFPNYPNYPNFPPNYPPGYPNTPEGPIVCPYNRYPLAGICVCKPRYYQTPSGECVSRWDPTDNNNTCQNGNRNCGPNGQFNLQSCQCVCRTGFYWTGNGCAPGVECPNNSTRISANECRCNPPLVLVNNTCSRCYSNGYWDGTKCIYLCPAFSTYNATSRRCVCNNGYGRTGPTTCTPCPANSRTINETCAVCPSNSQLIGQSCICNPGFRQNPQGFCVGICPQGAIYVPTIGRCRCAQLNFFINGTTCSACPANSFSNGIICTACPTGTVVDGNTCRSLNPITIFNPIIGGVVSCPFNSFPRNGVCVSCPINSTYSIDQDRCLCNTGYARVGALCINLCPTGIHIGGNLCAFCPLNAVPQNNICVCRLGYARYANGAACLKSCPGGTFLLSNGTCAACPINQGFNARTQRCQCLAGFVPGVGGLCVVNCPYASTVNAAGNCQCNARYYLSNSVCLSCPQTCLSCTGPTTCTTCIPGYSNVAGSCISVGPGPAACLTNQYRNGAGTCLSCPNMCLTCSSPLGICTQCATGFVLNVGSNTCTEVCGDGTRIIQQCDDGNTISGDGCSSTCTIEPGWVCMKNPLNPTLPDYCVNPNKQKDPVPSADGPYARM